MSTQHNFEEDDRIDKKSDSQSAGRRIIQKANGRW